MRVRSSDHVSVAVHELGGRGRPLLLSHATGFHGYCYLPIADELAEAFTAHAIDYRGHGDTARPVDDADVDWERYGDDATAAATAIAPSGGLVGFGHSMGATALLMAARRRPELFDLIVAVEPIVFPPERSTNGRAASPVIDGTRRRRASFPSFEDAVENFRSKPPMSRFHPDVLRLYVAHGFRSAPEGVRLKCDPEHEARTLEQSLGHPTWAQLPDIGTPVVVVGGGDGGGPATIACEVAAQLPHGRFVERPSWSHFGPLEDPQGAAGAIAEATAG